MRLEEPHCSLCGRAKQVVKYIYHRGQRMGLGLEEPFRERYPEGLAETLLACAGCDDVAAWPRSLKPKTRKTRK